VQGKNIKKKKNNTMAWTNDRNHTSERGVSGFSNSSPSMFTPVPWQSGQNTETIGFGKTFTVPSFPVVFDFVPFFFLDLRPPLVQTV